MGKNGSGCGVRGAAILCYLSSALSSRNLYAKPTYVKTHRRRYSHTPRFGVSLCLLAVALLASFSVSAQEQKEASKFDLELSGLWGGWHTQLTYFQSSGDFFQGGYGGLEFNKTIYVGWGLYKLQKPANYILPTDATLPVDIRYHGPMLYYTPYARSVLHPKFGLQTGFGRVNVRGLPEDKVFVLQPSVGGELNVFRWARLGAEVGYRAVLNVADPGVGTVGFGSDFLSGAYGQASLKFGFSWGSKNEQRR